MKTGGGENPIYFFFSPILFPFFPFWGNESNLGFNGWEGAVCGVFRELEGKKAFECVYRWSGFVASHLLGSIVSSRHLGE